MFLYKTKYTIGIFFLFLFSACRLSKIESHVLYAYALTNQQYFGDKNQILGICNALANHQKQQEIITKTFDITDVDKLEKELQHNLSTPETSSWIITSGDYGIEAIKHLQKYSGLKFCHVVHQQTRQHFMLLDVATIIALPAHALSQDFLSAAKVSKTALLQTIGVAHNLSEATIKNDYDNNNKTIRLSPPYIGIILAGDAPEPDGKMRYYTEQEAQKLAHYLAQQVQKKHGCLLILNGPRTGKYDPCTGTIRSSAHKDGQPDTVTEQFIQTLRDNGLKTDSDFQLFDFQFGQPSMYTTILGAIKETNGQMLVPGESTSMVSECTSLLSPSNVVIYYNQAMNEHHQAHSRDEYQAGHACVLDSNFQLWEPKKSTPTASAAAAIAHKIITISA